MSLYIGKVNNLHNKIHYTNVQVPESTLSTTDIVEGTIFNSRLGVFTVTDITTEYSSYYGTQHYIASGSKTYESLYLSSGGYVIQLYKISGVYYTKAELLAAGHFLTIKTIFLASSATLGVSMVNPVAFSCVNITLSRYVFPDGAIDVSNGAVKIGGVNIRDKQLLLFDKINNIDTYYSTVNSQLQILNSNKSAYPNTILKNDGIFASNGVTEEPLILTSSFMPLGVLTKNTVYPSNGNMGKVIIPGSSARFIYITLYVGISSSIDEDFVLPGQTWIPSFDAPQPFSFLADTQTIQYLNIFTHIATDSWQGSRAIGVKSYGSVIELTYQSDLSSSSACTSIWHQAQLGYYPPPTITEMRGMPTCQGLSIVDSYFPEASPDGAGGSLPFLRIMSCDYHYIL